MSELPITAPPPQWDTADRMRKALRESGISVSDIARYLDVDRSSVSNWINGRVNPSTQTLRLWAFRTGVPFEWLTTGKTSPPPDGPGDGETAGHRRWTRHGNIEAYSTPPLISAFPVQFRGSPLAIPVAA